MELHLSKSMDSRLFLGGKSWENCSIIPSGYLNGDFNGIYGDL
jgi:hypothetical protein